MANNSERYLRARSFLLGRQQQFPAESVPLVEYSNDDYVLALKEAERPRQPAAKPPEADRPLVPVPAARREQRAAVQPAAQKHPPLRAENSPRESLAGLDQLFDMLHEHEGKPLARVQGGSNEQDIPFI